VRFFAFHHKTEFSSGSTHPPKESGTDRRREIGSSFRPIDTDILRQNYLFCAIFGRSTATSAVYASSFLIVSYFQPEINTFSQKNKKNP